MLMVDDGLSVSSIIMMMAATATPTTTTTITILDYPNYSSRVTIKV